MQVDFTKFNYISLGNTDVREHLIPTGHCGEDLFHDILSDFLSHPKFQVGGGLATCNAGDTEYPYSVCLR